MRKSVIKAIPLIIVIITIFYLIGDNYMWWDKISMRNEITKIWEKLSYTRGGRRIIFLSSEEDYKVFYKFLDDNFDLGKKKKEKNFNNEYSAIARLGGTLDQALYTVIPEGWPKMRWATQTSPIIYINGMKIVDKNKGFSIENVLYITSLGEIRECIEKNRNSERFYIMSLLIGLLSLVVAINEMKK